MKRKNKKGISLKDLERTLRGITYEEDLMPYKVLGNDFYKLPGNIITNKRGLEMYLKELKQHINEMS